MRKVLVYYNTKSMGFLGRISPQALVPAFSAGWVECKLRVSWEDFAASRYKARAGHLLSSIIPTELR